MRQSPMRNKIKRLSKKIFSASVIIIILTFPHPSKASIPGFDFSTGEKMDDILDELGLDKAALQDEVMTFNSARFKKPQPQVSLTFTPTDPIDGQKVIATATPMYFMNDMKDMYFTWYLETADCPRANKNGTDSDKYNADCDLNKDEQVNVEDWKIKAMRIYANNDFNWSGADYSSDNDEDGYQAIHGGDDQKWKNNFCYVHDTKTGWEFLMYNKVTGKAGCDDPEGHLFPNATNGKGDDKETIGTTGDGVFTASEEKFWHTNPNDSDTADTGKVDEANIAGLGANEFSWTYSSGDKIGVVVEGISVEPTKAADSSFKTMWAMINNKCDIISMPDDYGDWNTSMVDITDQTTSMTVKDLNKCLYDNMTTPSESTGEAGKLNVTVSQTPTNPTNDSSGNGNGDKVSFVASLSDDVDSSYVSYKWEVFEADKANTDDWGDPIIKSDIPEATTTSGIGMNSFSFKMNFEDPKPYMKVKVTASETMSDGETREGHDFAIFPVTSISDGIKAYSSIVSNDGKISLDTSKELCVDDAGNPKSDCSVTKDQIVGLEFGSAGNYDNYSWTLNGEPITYKECFFDGCDPEKPTNKAFFPVVDNSGSSYNVQLIATKDTGEKVTLSKTFKIIDPAINIVSLDTTTCKAKYLGYFDNYNGTTTPVYSTMDFEAASGETIKLAPETQGMSLSGSDLTWFVDGNLTTAKDDGSIELPGKNNGEYYEISLSGHYAPDKNTIKALIQYWGVSYSEIYDSNIGKKISIRMSDSFSGQSEAALDRQKNKKLFATIASGIPAYLAFLIRITLSIGLIIFVMRLIFSLSPTTQENDY